MLQSYSLGVGIGIGDWGLGPIPNKIRILKDKINLKYLNN